VDSKTKNIVWKGRSPLNSIKSKMKAIAKFVDDNVRKYPKNPNQQTSLEIINEI
jgi:hypothetical protein